MLNFHNLLIWQGHLLPTEKIRDPIEILTPWAWTHEDSNYWFPRLTNRFQLKQTQYTNSHGPVNSVVIFTLQNDILLYKNFFYNSDHIMSTQSFTVFIFACVIYALIFRSTPIQSMKAYESQPLGLAGNKLGSSREPFGSQITLRQSCHRSSLLRKISHWCQGLMKARNPGKVWLTGQ